MVVVWENVKNVVLFSLYQIPTKNLSKKNLFLLGNDIWAEEESMKKKMCDVCSVEKPKKAIQV